MLSKTQKSNKNQETISVRTPFHHNDIWSKQLPAMGEIIKVSGNALCTMIIGMDQYNEEVVLNKGDEHRLVKFYFTGTQYDELKLQFIVIGNYLHIFQGEHYVEINKIHYTDIFSYLSELKNDFLKEKLRNWCLHQDLYIGDLVSWM